MTAAPGRADDPLGQWLQRLEGLGPSTIRMGLDRVEAVRGRMGLRPACPVIVVGGTNGKGSTAALLESMLRAAGYRTGCYLSPHLLHYTERIRIDGADIAEPALCAAFEQVEAARGDTPLTYFEFGTLAAVQAMVGAGVEAAVLEVGLGGRLDAVNAFDADCAIVTSIDLDHQDYLGPDREHIGREKAGIFRPGRPAIVGDPDPPATLLAHAAAIGARVLRLGPDFGCEPGAQSWTYRDARGRRVLPWPALRGVHQLANAACAVAALSCLRERLPVDAGALRRGLVEVRLPGRFQVLPGLPRVILDVGHNPHAAARLRANLVDMGLSGRTLAVFGMLADKDAAAVAGLLGDLVDHWHLASLHGPRGRTAGALRNALQGVLPDAPVSLHEDPASAFEAARAEAAQDDKILVFGSFHTVADVLHSIRDARQGA